MPVGSESAQLKQKIPTAKLDEKTKPFDPCSSMLDIDVDEMAHVRKAPPPPT